MSAERPEVLFVCVHNAGRSQMAAAFLHALGGDRVVVRSAGTAPADTINPVVVEAMAEIGIDLHANGAHPKRLEDAAVEASDVVVTMGCGDTCPFYPGTRYEDWTLDDPAGQGIGAIRPIRDEIRERVVQLLHSLGIEPATHRLSTLDRLLPLWIGVAMVAGLLLGRLVPDLDEHLDKVKIDTVSLPIALGLLLMMYPVLAKVRYGKVGEVVGDRRTLAASLVLNWLIGPALMFALAWLTLPDLPQYRTGLIIVGLARCIAMVLVWNDLADGNRELAAVLVAVNSLFQIVAYSLLGWFYLDALPGWLGLDRNGIDVTVWQIARSVLIFLGVPLVLGYLTRTWGERARGREWYEHRFLPRLGPFALYGLLFTVVVLFALQGERITDQPLDVARIAVPLLAYFGVMWFGTFWLGRRMRLPYDRNVSLSFTAAGNNFELAIAVCIAVFGVASGQALAGVVGPLIEVPVLVGLVYVAQRLRRTYTVR